MMKTGIVIRNERKDDYPVVENLVREAFWNVYRPGCSEHYVLHAFRSREDFVPELSFVMEKDGRIIGQVMSARAFIQKDDGVALPVMTLGPLCIHPDYKRQGLGLMLLKHSLKKAAAMGAGAVCLEGASDFYGKAGFVVASTLDIHYWAEAKEAVVPYFLCKELKEGYLDGVRGTYHTPEGYFVKDDDVEKFDAGFPFKEKRVLPGQLGS